MSLKKQKRKKELLKEAEKKEDRDRQPGRDCRIRTKTRCNEKPGERMKSQQIPIDFRNHVYNHVKQGERGTMMQKCWFHTKG